MKATLEIHEKEIKHEFDNLTWNQFRMIGEKPNDNNHMIIERYPIGESITLITSNMPDILKDKIVKMIELYCNH